MREIRDRSSAQGPEIIIDRRRYLNFSSNDYLGLASAPEISRAAIESAERYGFGGGASRLISGGNMLCRRLEELVAGWKGTDSALIFNSGYSANTGIIPSIASAGDVVFSDELNHASIIDGCRLSRARTVIYRHKDIAGLKKLLKSEGCRRRVIVTDTVFSMDGDIAPLADLYDLCSSINSSRIARNSLLLYLDDAHATGVLGRGKGALAHFGLTPAPWIIQMGTFSKALGSFGAFAAGSADTIRWLENTARSFIFSTALPAPVIAASMAAVRILMKRTDMVDRLWANRKVLASELVAAGFSIVPSETPIIPVMTASVREAMEMSEFLYARGIYVPAIRPPSVKGPRVRIVVTAAHKEKHLKRLISVMCRWKKMSGDRY